uniref:Uncharacterized protein n=1 Tax=viral metagenome TaxID=1070528 RepID=A0A6M3LN86_9ZZZZ
MAKCPYCDKEISLKLNDLKDHKMSMIIRHEGQYLKAKTVGGVITNMATLLGETSNNRVKVAFGGIEQREHELTIHFLVAESREDKP